MVDDGDEHRFGRGAVMGRWWWLGAMLWLAACGSATARPTPLPVTPQALTLIIAQQRFSPLELRVMAGTPVRLNVTNLDTRTHHFSIVDIAVERVTLSNGFRDPQLTFDPDLHMAVSGRQTGVLEFTPTEVGIYAFTCAVPGHQESGSLVVEP
jgi:uncharacterized cupredoxin-like copper-binding protein